MERIAGNRYWQSPAIANSLLILFTLAALVSGCERHNTPHSINTATAVNTPAGTKYLPLEHFESKRGTFELGIAPCTAEGCALEIHWLEANKLVSSIAMPLLAATQATQKETTDLDWGADPGLQAWATGEENSYVSTVVRPVMLDADTTGLLVTQHYGFDHIKRLHRLVVPRNGKLAAVWDFDESAGPTWSATAVLGKEAAGRVDLFSGFYNDDTPSEADRLGVTQLRWDSAKWQLVPDLGGKAATVLAAGSFKNPGEARKVKQADKAGCVSAYWVLSSGTIKPLTHGQSVLGKVFLLNDKVSIEQERQRLHDCGIKLKPSDIDIMSSPLPYEMR